MGHIAAWPDAPSFFLRGGCLFLTPDGDGYRESPTGPRVSFRLTEGWTGLVYELPGEMHNVAAEIQWLKPEGNRVCPVCGAVMREEISCPKRKKNLCPKHCRGCAWDMGHHCRYRTAVLLPKARLAERAKYILWHLRWQRNK